MEIAFGLAILAILVIGLINRGRQKQDWLKEERHEESGAWIDKRAGERGTYGSLDREREQERAAISRQGRVNELAAIVRTHVEEQNHGFGTENEDAMRSFTAASRDLSAELIATAEALLNGHPPNLPDKTPAGNPAADALKKQALDFTFAYFPALLDLDLDAIRSFDRWCGVWAERAMGMAGK